VPEGTLYLVGTPIGNLGDISFRALETLKDAAIIAAEDTRHTKKLLNHFEINTQLISYHQHNARERSQQLLEKLRAGQDVALVSDAGMPAISDPGFVIVAEAVANGLRVAPIPGPSASLAALVVSGLPTDRFVFEGFLPRKKEEVKKRLQALLDEDRTIIIYEAPHRIIKTLALCVEYLGAERRAVIARELTKKFEEILRGTLGELEDILAKRDIKGEFCLIIGGNLAAADKRETAWWENITTDEQIKLLINRGYTTNNAIKETARERGLPKREVYAQYHQQNDKE